MLQQIKQNTFLSIPDVSSTVRFCRYAHFQKALKSTVCASLWKRTFHTARRTAGEGSESRSRPPWFAERTFLSARCGKEDIGGGGSLGTSSILNPGNAIMGVTLRIKSLKRMTASCPVCVVWRVEGQRIATIILWNNPSSPGFILSAMKYCGLIPTAHSHPSPQPQRTELHIW